MCFLKIVRRWANSSGDSKPRRVLTVKGRSPHASRSWRRSRSTCSGLRRSPPPAFLR